MLCLKLKAFNHTNNDEFGTARIGDNIILRVISSGLNGDVVIGIEAPPDVVILRETVYKRAMKKVAQQREESGKDTNCDKDSKERR